MKINWLESLSFFAAALLLAPINLTAGENGDNESDTDESLPTITAKTEGMEKHDGFLTFYVDEDQGAVWLEIPPPASRGVAAEAIYIGSLAQGMGSNPVGLDRGEVGDAVLLEIRRIGRKVLFEELNFAYRALSDDPGERRAVRESFATSVVWGGEIAALDLDGKALVDLTSFLLGDAQGVAEVLKSSGQGTFSADVDRSVVELDSCFAFPDNVELEALVTWSGEEPGDHVRSTVPAPRSLTLTQHHSFVRPPEASSYRPRRSDPRMATVNLAFQDYAAPLDATIHRSWVRRHRLSKTDSQAERSKVIEPIVFYVDSGAPEPIRSALVEGASWWAEAFDRAGFVDAYRVEVLPDDIHPLDVRYNVIQWVHRSTRGWSYGSAVSDPRTGEILKGHVNLGSLRVRQDRLLFEGLVGTANTGDGSADDPVELALARLRQLAAHEVGHALGFAHNFAASRYDDRASVMDYPAPLVAITTDGDLDLSRAYGVGIGSWDVETVRYSYTQFAPTAAERAELEKIVAAAIENGHLFIADADARPDSAADSRGNLWDNGADAVGELEKALRVREIALARFGETNVRPGRPLAELEEVLAPLYFHHRYQLDAAIKDLGGLEISYSLRGDGQTPIRMVSGRRQRAAADAVLAILEPKTLDLSEKILRVLAPRAFGMSSNREVFGSATGPSFDALGAAATAADNVVVKILEPSRLSRLQDFHRRDDSMPGPSEILDRLMKVTFPDGAADEEKRYGAIRREVQRVVVDRLIAAATSGTSAVRSTLRSELENGLRRIDGRLDRIRSPRSEVTAHVTALRSDIRRFLDRDLSSNPGESDHPAEAPPGSPIGSLSWCTGSRI